MLWLMMSPAAMLNTPHHLSSSFVVSSNIDWGSKGSAQAAADVKQTLARLMGFITLEYTNVSPDTMVSLIAPFHVEEVYREKFYCNVDGEYTADGILGEEQITLTRLMDGVRSGLCSVGA
jgi:hypothetical protein